MSRSPGRWRHVLREYFTFTQSEMRGTVTLLVIIGLMIGTRWALPLFHKGKLNRLNAVHIENPDSLIAATTERLKQMSDSVKRSNGNDYNIADVEIEHSKFAFDPNTASFPDLLRLGFDKRIANNIVRYRSKGGRFKSGNDLLKIYGVDTMLVMELQPYIVLPEATVATRNEPSSENASVYTTPAKYDNNSSGVTTASYPNRMKKVVDLNTADSATLVTVNGIGPTYASRILKLRSRLGAFVSKEQLKDVYGITPEAYQTIEPNVALQPASPKKINLNTCTFDELRQHAYFNYKIAKAVIAYRDAHNGFRSVDELKNVEQVDEAFYRKIEPYVSVN